MSRETAVKYFSQKTGILIWLVGIVGLCMVYVGFAGERRSIIFMAAGAVLALLCVYEVVRGKRHRMTGAELDAEADAAVAKRNLYTCALKELCLDAHDVNECERLALAGYCTLPIQTRPYFRRDDADGKLRSSNYQTSLFIFSSDRFYTYSYVVSLVDKENAESGRMWRYDAVASAQIVREDFSYVVGTDDDKRESAPIEYLYLKDSEGHSFSFFFDRIKEGEAKAERIVGLLNERAHIPIAAKPERAQEEEFYPQHRSKAPSAAKGRDLGVGVIGDELAPPDKHTGR